MIQPTPTIAPKCRISGTAHFLVRLLCVSSNFKQKRRNVHAGRERGADGDVHSSATNSTHGQCTVVVSVFKTSFIHVPAWMRSTVLDIWDADAEYEIEWYLRL